MISFSVATFSWPQSFPASGSFPVSWLFALSGQSTRASASASALPIEYSGLIFFRIGWFDLLAIQGTLKSPVQHQSLKGSVLQCSVFFMVQLSHLYMTSGKTLTRQSLIAKLCLYFFICCLGLSQLFFQGASVF